MTNLKGMRLVQLVLSGHRKNYTIPFNPGVNIIYGDADTGKSSILRIVYYLLGGKQINLDHEISSSVKYATLEICIDGEYYCIQRDLYNSNRAVDVYTCEYDQLSDNFPKKYASSVSGSTDDFKSLSAFLLEAQGFPAVNLKQSPTKDNSNTARLSFLDLFKYVYLDQDDVGSTHMLNIGNHVVEVKNREVIKYIFSVLDSNISDVDNEISEKTKERNKLDGQLKVVSNFLSDTELESIDEITSEIADIEEETTLLESQLNDLNSRLVGDSELYNGFKDALNSISMSISSYEEQKDNALRNIDRFGRLKNDYISDVEKLKSTQLAKEVIGRDFEGDTQCPICETPVSLSSISSEFSIPTGDKVKHELNAITRRSKDIGQVIDSNRLKVDECTSVLSDLYDEKEKAKKYLDEELSGTISPYLTERDAIVTELSALKERRSKYRNALKVRNKQHSIGTEITRLDSGIESLKEKLKDLRENAPSVDSVIQSLGRELDLYLEKINIKSRFGVSISDKTFLPVIRDVEYRNINSGGMRTIVSIGYFAALLKSKLTLDTNIPGLLMIDTVGKFLGKNVGSHPSETSVDEDFKEGVSDPEKYKNIYEYLIELSIEFEERGKLCQIILVDNDMPPEISSSHKGFEVAHFSTNGSNNLSVGLIDDWDDIIH